MSYEPLHHKYRPQTLADLVGQETIAQTLSNALIREKIAPAYLFTGPRGTGKTSSARIFAKSLNCLKSSKPTPHPCGSCEVCKSITRGSALDVIEIDAASNTGVDNIREIIERAQFAPVQCRYKVYAIDECHMLSTAAFNALLKTLEEPPERVIFILATTDPQRVLPTIISRCQRFDYRRIPLDAMVGHLSYIAQNETIDITDEAITIIAQLANGGLRDAESLLDQLSLLEGTIIPERVWDAIGAVPEADLLILVRAIGNDNSELVIQQCRQILDRGKEPLALLQNLANFYLNLLIAKTSPHRPDLVAVTSTTWQMLIEEASHWQTELILQGQKYLKDSEVQLKNTTQPRLWLEITLLNLIPSANRVTIVSPTNNSYNSSSPAKTTTVDRPRGETPTTKLDSNNYNIDRPEVKAEVTAEVKIERQVSIEREEKQEIIFSKDNIPNEISPVIEEIEPQESEDDRETEISEPQINNSSQIIPEDIWQKTIEVVEPPTTKELLRQQCFLIEFDGNIAKIGIASPQLMKLHQGKLTNIEAAFSKICQRKVKAIFEVATLPRHGQKKTSDRASSELRDLNGDTNTVEKTSDRTDKVVDIESYRQEHREVEKSEVRSISHSQIVDRTRSQVKEVYGSNFVNKYPEEKKLESIELDKIDREREKNKPIESTEIELNEALAHRSVPLASTAIADNNVANNFIAENEESIEEIEQMARALAEAFDGTIIKIDDC